MGGWNTTGVCLDTAGSDGIRSNLQSCLLIGFLEYGDGGGRSAISEYDRNRCDIQSEEADWH